MSNTPITDSCEESYLRQTGEAINQDAIWELARKLERKLSALTTDRRGEGIPESRSSSPESVRPEPASAVAPTPDNVRDARARQAAGKGLPGDADVAHPETNAAASAPATAPDFYEAAERAATSMNTPAAPSKLPLSADTINYYRVHAINAVEEALCDQALAAIKLERELAERESTNATPKCSRCGMEGATEDDGKHTCIAVSANAFTANYAAIKAEGEKK